MPLPGGHGRCADRGRRTTDKSDELGRRKEIETNKRWVDDTLLTKRNKEEESAAESDMISVGLMIFLQAGWLLDNYG